VGLAPFASLVAVRGGGGGGGVTAFSAGSAADFGFSQLELSDGAVSFLPTSWSKFPSSNPQYPVNDLNP